MLMDMFYSATEGIVQHRKRLHFHEAMLQIHDLMHKVWKSQKMEKSFQSSISNWLLPTSFSLMHKDIEEELAFFALMKYRLLSTGTVLVATSNRATRDVNQDGMQKEIFKVLLVRMEERCENVLIGSEIDYCRHIAQSSVDQNHYFWPVDSTNTKGIRKRVEQDGRRVWREGHFWNSSSDVWKSSGF